MQDAELLVSRDKPLWQDRARNYQLLVDGKRIAEIGHGASVRIPLSPGRHTVQMKIDWCYSALLELDFAAGRLEVLECGANSNPFVALFYITLWRKNYLWLRQAHASPVN